MPELLIRLETLVANFVTWGGINAQRHLSKPMEVMVTLVSHLSSIGINGIALQIHSLTRNVVVQLVAVERALDLLLASSENISPFSAHGRGPNLLLDVVPL